MRWLLGFGFGDDDVYGVVHDGLGGMGFLEGGDLVRVLERLADLVQPFQQGVLAGRLDVRSCWA